MGGEGSEGQVREAGRLVVVVVVIHTYPINYLYIRGWVNG